MILSTQQKVSYLANVVGVARVNGVMAHAELQAFELVQKAIGARKADLKNAMKYAESSGFVVQPVGLWSDKIRNLEHIIYVAMSDGGIAPEEKVYVLEFARMLGITKEQLALVVREVKESVSRLFQELQCPACKSRVAADARFCPECGRALSEDAGAADSTPVESCIIPESGLAIEFAESTSASFDDALKVARLAPVFQETLKGKKRWYMAAWPRVEVEAALALVDGLSQLRNRKVHIDGDEQSWGDVFGFAKCASSRGQAYRPGEYCFGVDENRLNIWGCRQSRMDWSEWSRWFGYGQFTKKGALSKTVVFVFDKSRIRHELEQNLFSCRMCPHLQVELVEAVLEVLPDRVEPGSGDWRYSQDYQDSPGAIRVSEIIREGGLDYRHEYYSCGVRPASVRVGLEILKKAIARCRGEVVIDGTVLGYQG